MGFVGGFFTVPKVAMSLSSSSVCSKVSRRSRCLGVMRAMGVLVALVLAWGRVEVAEAQSAPTVQEKARTHYQAGQKAYAAGDFRQAIREFAAAEQASPSGYNDYNLGLCYDKLGEADPAVRYYRSYLERVKDAKNRVAVEASIARLEAALSSAQTKEQARLEAERKAEEARQAEAARKAEELRKAEEAKKAEELRKAEEAKKAEEDKQNAKQDDLGGEGPLDSEGNSGGEAPADENKISAAPTSTGNASLDRASSIDLAAMRSQREPLLGAPQGKGAAQAGVPNEQPKAKSDPIYKKWWFWGIIAVGGYVILSAALDDDNETRSGRGLTIGDGPAEPSGGATLLRW